MGLDLRGMAPLLQVFDMPTALRFYRDVLGFRVEQSSGEGDDVDWVLLERDGVELMLNTAYERAHRPPSETPARRDAHRDTALFFGCPDVRAAYEYLRARGVELKPPARTGYGWDAVDFTDPDGYVVVLHWPAE